MAVGAAGCQPMNVQMAYADEFDCPHDKVSVERISGGERYRVTGCDRTAMYQCIGNSCFPTSVEEPESAPESPTPVRNEQPHPTVETRKADLGGVDGPLVVADVPIGNYAVLKLRAAPSKRKDLVQLKLARLEPSPPELEDCELDLMVNGERLALPKAHFARKARLSSLMSELPAPVVRELGAAQQMAIKVCDLRWSLDAEQVDAVRAFVARYQEELAWTRDPKGPSGSGMVAPADGWPEWKPDGTAPAAATGDPLGTEELFRLLSPSIYQIEAISAVGTLQGSAVAVTPTELLTNCHVLEGAQRVIAKQGKKEYVVRIGRSEPKTDRCVLVMQDPIMKPIRGVRAYADLKVGEAVYTLGAPKSLELTMSDGLLSGLREEDGRALVQTTAPISPGSSGGGLFDSRGNLVGITTAVLMDKQRKTQAINFAIPADSFWKP